MLKTAKRHLFEKAPEFTMEAILNDHRSLEGWFSQKKEQKAVNVSRDKLNELLRQNRQITDERELQKTLAATENEMVNALTNLDIGFNTRILQMVGVELLKDVLDIVKFKRRAPRDILTLMRHLSYIHGRPDFVFDYIPVPLDVESLQEEDRILYDGENVILYVVKEGSDYSVKISSRWWMNVNNLESRGRIKVVDDVKTGLYEHLKHVYRKFDEESVWINDQGIFEFDYDNIFEFKQPDDAVFDYDKIYVQYHNGASTYDWIVEEKGHTIVITWDSGDSREIWVR
jgi:hypothetical protein